MRRGAQKNVIEAFNCRDICYTIVFSSLVSEIYFFNKAVENFVAYHSSRDVLYNIRLIILDWIDIITAKSANI